jgi:hypothetical protein
MPEAPRRGKPQGQDLRAVSGWRPMLKQLIGLAR